MNTDYEYVTRDAAGRESSWHLVTKTPEYYELRKPEWDEGQRLIIPNSLDFVTKRPRKVGFQ